MLLGQGILVEDSLAVVSAEPYRPTDDAMDWSTDDMVRKLCQEPLLLPQILDLAALAEAFRKHRITGVLLLCDIDDKALRKDFNIDNIGQRASIRRVIEELRLRSVRYRAKARRSYQTLCGISLAQDIGPTAVSDFDPLCQPLWR
jgi:hypothetical protein